MIAAVKLTCDGCQDDVVVPYGDCRLLHYSAYVEYVAYRCPVCGTSGMVPLPIMFAARARQVFQTITMPEFALPSAEPLTEDDLIAFGLELEGAQEITA